MRNIACKCPGPLLSSRLRSPGTADNPAAPASSVRVSVWLAVPAFVPAARSSFVRVHIWLDSLACMPASLFDALFVGDVLLILQGGVVWEVVV
jgi:hypothetical protein